MIEEIIFMYNPHHANPKYFMIKRKRYRYIDIRSNKTKNTIR